MIRRGRRPMGSGLDGRLPDLPACARFRTPAECIALVEGLLNGCPVAHSGRALVIPRAAWFAVGVGGHA